jgi:uncharacterized protein (DUF1778 family)
MAPRKTPAKTPVQFNLRVQPDEMAAFRKAADRAGLDLSAWLRQVARRAAGLPTVADAMDE